MSAFFKSIMLFLFVHSAQSRARRHQTDFGMCSVELSTVTAPCDCHASLSMSKNNLSLVSRKFT